MRSCWMEDEGGYERMGENGQVEEECHEEGGKGCGQS